MHAEMPFYRDDPYEADRVRDLAASRVAIGGLFVADSWITTNDSGCAFSAAIAPIGMAGCLVAPHFATGIMMAIDIAVYVVPKHRGGMTAIRLIRALEGWARDQGARRFTMAPSSGLRAKRTERLYARLGYMPVGLILEKDLTRGP